MKNVRLQRFKILVSILLMTSFRLVATDYFWVGGNGNWGDINHWSTSSGGSVLHNKTPGSGDNVYFDSNSFSTSNGVVSINVQTAFCALFSVKNISNFTLNLPTNSTIRVFGSVDIDRINLNGGGTISCESPLAGNIVRTSGTYIPNLIFSNSYGEWTQMDTLKVGSFTKNSGSYISGSNYIEAYNITIDGGNSDFSNAYVKTTSWNVSAGSLNMSNTLMKILSRYYVSGVTSFTSAGSKVWHSGYEFTDYALPAHTYDSVFFLKNYNIPRLQASTSMSANYISFEANGKLSGIWNVGHLMLTPSQVYHLASGSQISITTIEALGDCNNWINIESETRGSIANLVFSQANNSSYLRLRDVAVSGSAWLVSPHVVLGNVSGISGSTYVGKSMYWVGGSGKWKDPQHWSNTNGGVPAGCIPGPMDTVYFTNNSGTSSVNVSLGDSVVQFHSMYAVNSNITISFTGSDKPIQAVGSFELSSAISWNVNKAIAFYGVDTTYTVRTSGKCLEQISFLGGGKWSLVDTLCTDHLSIINGTLDASSKGMSLNRFTDHTNEWGIIGYQNSDEPELMMDSSLVTIDNQIRLMQYGFRLAAVGSRVNCSSGVGFYTSEPSLQWNIVEWVDSSGTAHLDGSEQRVHQLILNSETENYSTLIVDTLTLAKGKSYKFSYSVSFKKINAIGGCNDRIIVRPMNTYSNWNGAGYLNNFYYGLFENIRFTNGTLNALNSVDLAGNTGVNFVTGAGRTLYWVGGSGDWDEATHWSLTSGGSGGECIPTPSDSVVFDDNSSTGNMTMEISSTAFAKDLTAFNTTFDINVANSPAMASSSHIEVYGNVWFSQRINYNYSRELVLKADTGSFLFKTSNIEIEHIEHEGGAIYTLIDTLKLNRFEQTAGKFQCNANHVDVRYFTNSGGEFHNNNGTMEFDYLYSYGNFSYPQCIVWVSNTAYLAGQVQSPNASLIFTGLTPSFTSSSVDTISQVIFENSMGKAQVNIQSSHVSFMQFSGWAYLNRSTSVDSCVMTNGNSYFFNPNYQHHVYKYWDVDGDFCNPILLRSQNQGLKANVYSGDTVSADFLEIRDLNYSGTSAFYTGLHSVDQGNNSGIVWTNKPGYIYGLGQNIQAFRCTGDLSSGVLLSTENFQDAQSFLWSDSSTASNLWVTSSGLYWCTANYGSCQVTDTIAVQFFDSDFGLADSSGFCQPTLLTLTSIDSAANAHFSVKWSTGDTIPEIQFSLNSDTVIYVQILQNQKVVCTDTIHLFMVEHTYRPKSLNLLSCATSNLKAELINYLAMPVADSVYFDFSDYDSLNHSYIGILNFTYYYGGCSIADSMQLNVGNPFPVIPGGGLLCEGSTVNFKPLNTIAGLSYTWSDGVHGAINSKVISASGRLVLEVRDDLGHTCADSVEYTIGNPVTATVRPQYLSGFQPYRVQAFGEGNLKNYSYWLFEGDTISLGDTLTYQFENEGTYEVYYIAQDTLTGCYAIDTLVIQVNEREAVWVPNAFTPNGDGINDLWRFQFAEHITGPTQVEVFNRWGELIYFTVAKEVSWDGTHEGHEIQTGAYVYIVRYLDQGQQYKKYGTVKLIR